MYDLPAPPALRPLVVFAAIALCLGLSSCQCTWKPDVGPVEEEEQARAVPASPVPGGALPAVPFNALS